MEMSNSGPFPFGYVLLKPFELLCEVYLFIYLFFVILWMEFRTLHMLGKFSAQVFYIFLFWSKVLLSCPGWLWTNYGYPPAPASRAAGVTDMCHHAQLFSKIWLFLEIIFLSPMQRTMSLNLLWNIVRNRHVYFHFSNSYFEKWNKGYIFVRNVMASLDIFKGREELNSNVNFIIKFKNFSLVLLLYLRWNYGIMHELSSTSC